MAKHTTDDALRHADGMCDPMSAAYIRGLVDLVNELVEERAKLRELLGERDSLEDERDRMVGEIRAVYDRCTTAVAIGTAFPGDADAQAQLEMAEELLGEIEGSTALEGLEYDDPEPAPAALIDETRGKQ